ncbi:MAG: PilZ domain-containing protein [Pseudomonadota bacterium]
MTAAFESSTNRRTYIRLAYGPGRRPALLTADARFEIIDISESGIRFHNPSRLPLAQSFQARISLLGGGAIDIDADVQWQQNGEVGISLAEPLPAALIKEEQRRAILQDT